MRERMKEWINEVTNIYLFKPCNHIKIDLVEQPGILK